MTKQLTIFTPTYNRAYSIGKLYDSLCKQTSDDFVWLVIDDGSTDNTKSLLKKWSNEGLVDIQYVYQNNSGKMKAHNRAVELCKTELFMCVDSDDQLASPIVIEDCLNFWNLQKKHNFNGLITYKEISGVISYKRIENSNTKFPSGLYCSSLMNLYNRGLKGDTSLMFVTRVIRKYPFPEIDGEKFIPESISYDKIDLHYKYILFPYYSQACEYRNDGYTLNMLSWILKYPRGMRMSYNQNVYFRKKTMIKDEIRYIALSLLIRDGTLFSASCNKLLTIILYPLGSLLYLKYRRLHKILNET